MSKKSTQLNVSFFFPPLLLDAKITTPKSWYLNADQALLLEVLDNLGDALLHRVLVRVDRYLGLVRGLVRRRDTSKVLDLASPGLLVQTLGVTLLGDLNGDIDVDLDKGQGRIAAGAALLVQVARDLAVGLVRADEAGDGDGAAVGEQLGDLGDAANVLVAVLLGEAEVLVQAEAHVVAVEAVGGHAQVQEVLLQGGGDGGFARGGEACEPDGEALLFAEGLALGAGEGGVPGDVARDFGGGGAQRLVW